MKNEEAGFTIIEAAVALGVMGIVVTSVSGLMMFSTRTVDSNALRQFAKHLAVTEIETLRATQYDEIVDRSRSVTWRGTAFALGTDVDENQPAAGMKTIRVAVDWRERERARAYATRTIYIDIR